MPSGIDLFIATDRLRLRRWRPSDRPAFAALNDDPIVTRFLPRRLGRAESDAWADRIEAEFARDGFGLWAVEVPGIAPFAGFTGLNRVAFAAAFAPAVEIGWRFAPAFHGHGYATEAARAALRAGFERYGLDEIVAETSARTRPSRRVMERVGLVPDAGSAFDHPEYRIDDPNRPSVLYRKRRPAS